MTKMIALMTARLQRDVPAAEAKVDDAIIARPSLITYMVAARRETGVPASTGQATILRLAKAQMSLVGVSNDVLRIHGELLDVNRKMGSNNLRGCPPASGEITPRSAAMA